MYEDRHEIIQFSSNIPLKIFMHKIGFVSQHWHKELELLMILEGIVDITVDGQSYTLRSEDIILVNANNIHEIHSEGAVMIAVQIDLMRFDNLGGTLENIYFECNSVVDKNKEKFGGLKYAIATMIRENAHNAKGVEYKNLSISYYLLSELLAHFQASPSKSGLSQKKHMERLTRLVNYIQEHYRENFSLSDLAEAEGLSVPYLSSFFDKYMGIKFSQYYIDVKLEHASSDLLYTTDSIEDIAIRNGFTESHAFVRAFKKKYNMLPSTWRKEQQNIKAFSFPSSNLNYLLIEPTNYLHLLTHYAPVTDSFYNAQSVTFQKEINIGEVNVSMPIKTLRHTFKKFISVGRAKELLNFHIQEMLKDIQENIGYEFIKFHGILSDDMMVVSRSQDGKLHFHYTLVDMAMDFILSIGLKPMIQLSFMPSELASDPDKQIFYIPFNTSPPQNMDEWNLLIKNFTLHLLKRYGEREVLSWPFTVWNEPITPTIMFGFGNDTAFFNFYKNTFDTVKSVHSKIRFGSPSLLYMEHLGNEQWLRYFLEWTKINHCFPEFINLHYYADILPNENRSFGMAPTSSFPKRTDDFSLWIGSIRKILNECGAGSLPHYLTEWNFTFSHRNLINDTCFKSCYILKNLLRNYDRLDSFGYWTLTDLLEENALPDSLFHGGLGLYTMNGLRKNVFYSFYFTNMLGDELLACDEGYFITRKGNDYQIITYNYVHYGDLFASGELYDITETNRYSTFDMSVKIQFNLELKAINNGSYEMREYFVNREYGSAFDLWVKSGAMDMDAKDTELFKGMCVPGYHKELRLVEKNKLHYAPILEPLEIRFAEIRFIE